MGNSQSKFDEHAGAQLNLLWTQILDMAVASNWQRPNIENACHCKEALKYS